MSDSNIYGERKEVMTDRDLLTSNSCQMFSRVLIELSPSWIIGYQLSSLHIILYSFPCFNISINLASTHNNERVF